MPRQLRLKGHEFADRWLDALHFAASECRRYRKLKIFFATFLSDSPANSLLAERPHSVNLTQKADYWVGMILSQDKPRTPGLSFGVFKSGPNAWTLFTLTETIANETRLLRLARSFSPNLSEAYLSSADIRQMLQKLEETHNVHLFVNKAVAYSHRREGQISFKKEPYHAVFNRAEHEGMFIDKVDFLVRNSRSLHAFIARNGSAKFLSGDIDLFIEGVLTGIVNTTSRRHLLFHESIRRRGEVEVYPIDIDFGQTAFQDREDNLTFLASLDSMTRSGMAVLHENPYVHVSLIDFTDGSSFDIFATTPNAITVIPQVAASPFALNRLCNHIFENFHEGKIAKPTLRQWHLQDVLA